MRKITLILLNIIIYSYFTLRSPQIFIKEFDLPNHGADCFYQYYEIFIDITETIACKLIQISKS